MNGNDRIVKVSVGSKVRVAARVADGLQGAAWVEAQISQLHLDAGSVEFGSELGIVGREVWVEGYVTAGADG